MLEFVGDRLTLSSRIIVLFAPLLPIEWDRIQFHNASALIIFDIIRYRSPFTRDCIKLRMYKLQYQVDKNETRRLKTCL